MRQRLCYYRVGLIDVRGLSQQACCETLQEVQNWLALNDHEGAGPALVERIVPVPPEQYGYPPDPVED